MWQQQKPAATNENVWFAVEQWRRGMGREGAALDYFTRAIWEFTVNVLATFKTNFAVGNYAAVCRKIAISCPHDAVRCSWRHSTTMLHNTNYKSIVFLSNLQVNLIRIFTVMTLRDNMVHGGASMQSIRCSSYYHRALFHDVVIRANWVWQPDATWLLAVDSWFLESHRQVREGTRRAHLSQSRYRQRRARFSLICRRPVQFVLRWLVNQQPRRCRNQYQ